ncbi:hypothetical protein [Candidatus Korarchaeum cryptofilum]|nr:hypothetical protein [Candidatus Korarchaeum cryptofilum]
MGEMRSSIIILILLLINFAPLLAEKPPSVAIISNKADEPTAIFLGGLLSESRVQFDILGPRDFQRALENYDVIILLGGPKAYDGVGEISSNYIPPENATNLINEPRTFLISIYKGGRDIIVIAGHTRQETKEAVPYFFRDPIRVTKLWRWAGYPVDFRDGSYSIYYVEKWLYDNESMKFYSVPWGSEVIKANKVTLNGSSFFNVTYKSSYIYLGVNYTSIDYYIVDELNRPKKCVFVQLTNGEVSSKVEGCPSGDSGLGGTQVYVTFKMEDYGNRTEFEIAGNPVRRSRIYQIGDKSIRAVLVIKYAMRYPSWEALAPFQLMYVNPSLPFGGRVIEVNNRFLEGVPVTDTVLKLYQYKP